MKKVLLVLTMILFILSLNGCSLDELEAEANKLPPVQDQRFINDLIAKNILGGNYHIVNIGDVANITIENWGSTYIIVESELSVEVDVKITIEIDNQYWGYNVYYDNDLSVYDLTFYDVESGDVIKVLLQPGFNIIELLSFIEQQYTIIIEITERVE